MAWKYRTEYDLTDEALQVIGKDGWELISKIYHPPRTDNQPARIEGNEHFYASSQYFPARYEFTFKRLAHGQ